MRNIILTSYVSMHFITVMKYLRKLFYKEKYVRLFTLVGELIVVGCQEPVVGEHTMMGVHDRVKRLN